MNRLSRYLFVECGSAILLVLVVLTTMMMFPTLLKFVNLWVHQSGSVLLLATLVMLTVPKFLVGVLPIALMLGILTALGQLSRENELVILKASGVSLYQTILPLTFLVTLFTLLAILLNMVWVPQTFLMLKETKQQMGLLASVHIMPKTVIEPVAGLTLYVRDNNSAKQMFTGIVIYDRRKPKQLVTFTAKSGRFLIQKSGDLSLLLQEGARYQILPNDNTDRLKFEFYHLNLGFFRAQQGPLPQPELRGLSLMALKERLGHATGAEVNQTGVEWHRRWSLSLATFILGLFAIPLGFQNPPRVGRSYGFFVGVLSLLGYFTTFSIAEAVVQQGYLEPSLGLWLPNFIMGWLTLYVIVQVNRGKLIFSFDFIEDTLQTLSSKLGRPFSTVKRNHSLPPEGGSEKIFQNNKRIFLSLPSRGGSERLPVKPNLPR